MNSELNDASNPGAELEAQSKALRAISGELEVIAAKSLASTVDSIVFSEILVSAANIERIALRLSKIASSVL